ncbi:hypothetical protein [uncultured Devosia sp.]|uniref:hypothetical protein n=1 Tax=uncultured Devosia sp. TaxID=211434 RepID=UPI0035CB5082
MTISSKTIHNALRACALTALVGLGAVTSPVLAQSPGFGFGGDFDDYDDDYLFPERILCMTERQMRQAIADRGYSNVTLNVPHNKRVQARGTMNGTVYLIKFNYCSDRIEDRDALRAAQ